VKRVGLFAWMARENTAEAVEKHRRALREDCEVELFDFAADLPESIDLDLAVVLGGDGTILGAARYLAPRGIAAVGINLGRFGFLAGCDASKCKSVVEGALSGDLDPVSRTMLRAEITGGGSHEELIALNDITVTSSVPTHMIGIALSINGIEVSTFQGDGLKVATATGSTAYNLSSGGPLVAPTEDVIILTGLAPHTLSIRPMVISGCDVVETEVSGRQADITVTADGQVARTIKSGRRVRFERAPYRFHLYEDDDWSFYRVVRSKLRWGEEPNYAQDSD